MTRAPVEPSRVSLRRRAAEDEPAFWRWSREGEWLAWDAPWEAVEAQSREDFRTAFLRSVERDSKGVPRRAVIELAMDGEKAARPVGWVSRYGDPSLPDCARIGIDLCEDDALGKGIGRVALRLWIGHLFAALPLHRIGLDTWSYNERMIKVARAIGFVEEGRERELREWKGTRIDLVRFGLLAREWRRTDDQTSLHTLS
jgi:RimJ/RimL family protein N-acetyltransferase